jgi:hypothetical protein
VDLRYTTAEDLIRRRDYRSAWRCRASFRRAAARLASATDPDRTRDHAADAVRDAIACLILAGGNGSDVLRAIDRLPDDHPQLRDRGGSVGERGDRELARRQPGPVTDPHGIHVPAQAHRADPIRPDAFADPAFLDAEYTTDD